MSGAGAVDEVGLADVAPKPVSFEVFTCDRGRRTYRTTDPPHLLAQVLNEVLESGFWRQLCQFPPQVVADALPELQLEWATRRLVEIWLEERGIYA